MNGVCDEGRRQTVLIIVVARIGDTLLATPAIEAMRRAHPNAAITVMAHPKRLPLLQHLRCIDRLQGITKHRARWRGWFSRRSYDLALVYGSDRELVRYALRVSRLVAAFEQDGLPNVPRLIRVARPSGCGGIHAVQERALLAQAVGAPLVNERLQYVVTPHERVAARTWLATRSSGDLHPLIAIQIASFPTKAHRDWPVASFSDLIGQLLAVYPQAHFILLGDTDARKKATTLAERFGSKILLPAGTTSLRESAALIACADLYIGVDTGPTHIAGAVGVPMVALYHNAYPGRHLAPLNHADCIVIEHPMSGQSHSIDESMADISVERVFQAARQLLDRQRDTAPQ